jgi:hypothetical protein
MVKRVCTIVALGAVTNGITSVMKLTDGAALKLKMPLGVKPTTWRPRRRSLSTARNALVECGISATLTMDFHYTFVPSTDGS